MRILGSVHSLKRRSDALERLRSYSAGFYAVWAAEVGRRTGLFSKLSQSAMTEAELAGSLGLYLPAVRAWCQTARAFGFLAARKSGRFGLAPGMRELLVDTTHPHYIAGQYAYLALRSLDYGSLDGLFRAGRTRPMSGSFEAIEEATHWDHYSLLRFLNRRRRLRMILSRGCSFADIGCGTGSLGEKLFSHYPRVRYFGLDSSPIAVRAARKRLLGRQAIIKKIGAENMRMEQTFDIVYLGESLFAARDKSKVVENCRRSLRDGGVLVVGEGLLPNRARRDDLLIMGMQLDFALQGYRFMTRQRLVGLIRDAGFHDIAVSPLGGSFYIATAVK